MISGSVYSLVLLIVSIICVNGQNNIGDACYNKAKNTTGQCTRIKDCNSAVKDVFNGLNPQICGFQESTAIVCCPNGQPSRIAEQKCWEYSKSVFKIIPSPINLTQKPFNISTCSLTTTQLIPNSSIAKDKEFPHMVVLGYGSANKKKWFCAGTLISDKFILTAAHCVNSRKHGEVKFIRLGELNLEATNDGDPQDFYVTEIIRHPNYLPPSKYNDIALLKMDRPAKFNEFIRPACLHLTKDIPNTRYMATRWDTTELIHNNPLQKNIFESYSQEQCNASLETDNLRSRILRFGINSETQLCAFSKEMKKDICQGDSGGPLQIYHPQAYCMYSIIGVSSFGPVCGLETIPSVYTRVSHYIDWIEENVWP